MEIDSKKQVDFVDGIAFFSANRYWGKMPEAELIQALNLIDQKGWSEFEHQYKDKFDFTFEENRADWRFVLPLTKNSKILDVGAGMGRISIPLARVAGRVIAIDQSFWRLKFLKKRAAQERLDNIEVYVSDIFDQPFSPESFDLIVLNGLLEWVGSTERYSSPQEAQLACLKICYRLLKKGGHLYVGIENRLALAYLRGRDHSGLRYTSYLPRWLANIYTQFRLGRRYDTYTYTKHGYEKLLKAGGFEHLNFYLPYPGYNLPRLLIPYQRLDSLAYLFELIGSHKPITKYLIRFKLLLRLYRYLFFSFSIVAQK